MKTQIEPYFLVVGLGASGVSMAKLLCSKGKRVIATDIDPSRIKMAEALHQLGIKTQIGFHDQNTFNRAGVIIPSPGIPKTNTFIQAAARLGVEITGELDIFTRYNTLPIIAITGTNGKTTTTTLIGDILKSCGLTPFVGGNIGTPLVDYLMNSEKADVIVAEISSFQLDLSHRFRPDVGVLLNISDDHMDRYENAHAYERSKWSLFNLQTSSDTAVINDSIKDCHTWSKNIKSRIFSFSSDKNTRTTCHAGIYPEKITIAVGQLNHEIKTTHLKELPGTHNKENAAAAVLACMAMGMDIDQISKGLETFKSLPHRMQFVRTIDGISFYNDSKGTNTDAVIRAINCLGKNIILILGGREKQTDFSLLTNDIQHRVKTIIAMGECREQIKDTFKDVCPVLVVHTMRQAVQTAFDKAVKDDRILLSPACASFDMYENYAHRGNDFVTHVNRLGNE